MSIIAAATSRADFYTVGNTAAVTTAAHIAPYAKEGVSVNDNLSYLRFVLDSGVSEGWIRFHFRPVTYPGTGSHDHQLFRLKGSEAGQVLFQLDADWNGAADIVSLEYWNGSAFTEVGEIAAPFIAATLYKIDVQFKMDNSAGYIRVYINDALTWEYTGDTIFTAATTLNTIELSSVFTGIVFTYSGFIVADEDTRSMVFHQGQATADGANTAWTGTYADVTELDRDDNDFIESGVADQLETFVMDDVHTDLAAYVPRAVVLSTRTRRGATGPQNMQGAVRQAGTDFFTSNLAGITTAYSTRQAVMNTNPATAAAWTISEINANEFGVKSIA